MHRRREDAEPSPAAANSRTLAVQINSALLAGEPNDSAVREIDLRDGGSDTTGLAATLNVGNEKPQALVAIQLHETRGLVIGRIEDEVCGAHCRN